MPDLFGFGSVEVFAKTDPTELRRNAPLPAAPAVFRNSRRLKKLFLVPESSSLQWQAFGGRSFSMSLDPPSQEK
jgi:hypothetical protein